MLQQNMLTERRNNLKKKSENVVGMVVHTCNASTWETKARGLRVWDKPELHEAMYPKKKKFREGNKNV